MRRDEKVEQVVGTVGVLPEETLKAPVGSVTVSSEPVLMVTVAVVKVPGLAPDLSPPGPVTRPSGTPGTGVADEPSRGGPAEVARCRQVPGQGESRDGRMAGAAIAHQSQLCLR